MIPSFLYVFKGYSLVFQSGYKRYSLTPMLINAISFIALYAFGLKQTWQWFSQWHITLPSGLSWFESLWAWIQPILFWLGFIGAGFILLFVVGLCAAVITTILASPFNSLLAEKILHEHGVLSHIDNSWRQVAWQALTRETAKLLYTLWRSVLVFAVCIPFFFIPGLNLIASSLLFLLGSWMLSVEYLDYPFEANQQSFTLCRQWLRGHKAKAWGFGMGCMAATSLPLLNLISVPAGIAGATLCYIQHIKKTL